MRLNFCSVKLKAVRNQQNIFVHIKSLKISSIFLYVLTNVTESIKYTTLENRRFKLNVTK